MLKSVKSHSRVLHIIKPQKRKAPTYWSMLFGWGIGIFIASLALVATRQTLHRRVCSLREFPSLFESL